MEQIINRKWYNIPQGLAPVLAWALLLRVVLFFIVINSSDPFIISDDRAYEEISKTYLQYANGLWDWNAVYATGGDNYLQVFWPYCICIFAKIFGTEYAGRILNIILSMLSVILVYDIALIITKKVDKGMLAAKLMAFLPYPLIFSVFNIKDFYIMFGVFYAMRLFVKWQYDLRVRPASIAICILLLIGVYFARGGVVEFVGIAFVGFLCNKYYNKHQYGYIVGVALGTLIAAFFLSDSIIDAFDTKADVYGDLGLSANGLRMVQMHGITEFYKLPMQYLFAMISPFATNYFAALNDFTWLNLLTTLNISLYPIAIANILYTLKPKQNMVFWLTTIIIFLAITSMVLAIPRHYFFLFPIHIVNFVCFMDIASSQQKSTVRYLSFGLFVLIFTLSLVTL